MRIPSPDSIVKFRDGFATDSPTTDSERLDLYLVRLGWARSRRAAKDLIFAGRVRVNGVQSRKGEPIAPGDRVEVEDATPPSAALVPDSDLRIDILYEDATMLVVAKPGLIPCHPLRPGERGTAMNAIVARYPEVANAGVTPLEGGLVHRLDNGTSGALIIARTQNAFASLRSMIRSGAVTRRYHALIAGQINRETEIAAAIAHHPKNSRKMVVVASPNEVCYRSAARPAFTLIRPVERVGKFTLVDALPRTGSRHQIRVHLASIGHPIVGDILYGGPPAGVLAPGRFWLHLLEVTLDSPAGGRTSVNASIAQDLAAALKQAR